MELKRIVEALLLASPKPLSAAELRDVLRRTADEEGATADAREFRNPGGALDAALSELAAEHAQGPSVRLVCVAGAWQFATAPECAAWVRTLVGAKNRPPRLTQPALETLAVVAYRQPVTRAEIEQIRGVAVDGVLATLKERGLVAEVGRAEAVGRPVQLGTTAGFLEYFGLASLDDLPAADELRRLPVSRPEAPLTVDAQLPLPGSLAAPPAPSQGLAGVPPAPAEPVPAPDAGPPVSATDVAPQPSPRSSEEPPLDGGGALR